VSADAGLRDGGRAVTLAERAALLSHHSDPLILDVLAAAYAEAGRFGDAVATAEAALDLARRSDRSELAEQLMERLRLYRAGLPFHEGNVSDP
jgi:spermidine synthase